MDTEFDLTQLSAILSTATRGTRAAVQSTLKAIAQAEEKALAPDKPKAIGKGYVEPQLTLESTNESVRAKLPKPENTPLTKQQILAAKTAQAEDLLDQHTDVVSSIPHVLPSNSRATRKPRVLSPEQQKIQQLAIRIIHIIMRVPLPGTKYPPKMTPLAKAVKSALLAKQQDGVAIPFMFDKKQSRTKLDHEFQSISDSINSQIEFDTVLDITNHLLQKK